MPDLAHDALVSDELNSIACDAARARVAALGHVPGNTPAAIYKEALGTLGMDAAHIPAAHLREMALRAIALRTGGARGASPAPMLATDAAPADDFATRYGVTTPRVLG